MTRSTRLAVALLLPIVGVPAIAPAETLEASLGRAETRVWSAPYPLRAGRTVAEMALPERLERLGYRRVHDRPVEPGTWFWGTEVVWIHRREHRAAGRDRPARLIGLALDAEGRVAGGIGPDGAPVDLDRTAGSWLEPELLAESLTGNRARRDPVRLAELPEPVWRAVLAAEDHRFFDHAGVDARAIARALVANLREGEVAQGGSTITQQLVKNRDLTPRRTLGRKVSEAVRALWLEAEHSKEEILEAYLNHVYFGQVEGVGLYGIGAASRALFGKPPARLDLAEAAALAGAIRSPNRLSPTRHPEAARERRDGVLARMEELGWASPAAVAAARATPVRARVRVPAAAGPASFLGWMREVAEAEAGERLEDGRGIVVETTLDPWLQARAEEAVRGALRDLRRRRELRDAPLGIALVSLDARTGDVLAAVGGDPDAPAGSFDRVRQARRQPGSVVKPLILLEAFGECGGRGGLHGATRVADEPVTVELEDGRTWSPRDADRRYRGTVSVREALRDSRNVPFVRIARHCGFDATAARLRSVGLPLPDPAPPSFVLGAVEASPLEVARAYSVFAVPGRVVEPRPFVRLETPAGRRLEREFPAREAVAAPAAAWMVADLLREAAEQGTAREAHLDGIPAAAKTGTSSETRDAWLAGVAGSVVTVVWVGRDDGRPLGLSGSRAAAPVWRRFMAAAAPARPPLAIEEPSDLVWKWVDAETGLLVRKRNPHAVREPLRRDALPRRDRFWRIDEAEAVVR